MEAETPKRNSEIKQKRFQFRVYGMDCAEEVSVLRRELLPLVKDESCLQFDLIGGRLTVVLNESEVTPHDILAAIQRTGLQATPLHESYGSEKNQTEPVRKLLHYDRKVFFCLISGVACSFSGLSYFLLHFWGETHGNFPILKLLAHGTAGLAVVFGGWFIFPRAVLAARRFQPDMNLLMTIAVLGALLLGEWFEAAVVTFLFCLALLLESWSVSHARKAISSLLQLTPSTARCRNAISGEVVEKPVDEVTVGTTVVVYPGEKVPLDGVILVGTTFVNEAPITGESLPAEKTPGMNVFAGTLNLYGAFEFRVTREARDTTLARIVHMIEEAQSRRAPTERWVDRFARVYTPVMLVIACIFAIFPPVFLGGNPTLWIYEALVILVIACPCALVISTPVSVVAGLASAARAGVLIKGGLHLELPSQLRAIALDKTGTLTRGVPEIQRIVPLNNHSERELLARAASLEAYSAHPLAEAVIKRAKQENIVFDEINGYKALPGKGGVGILGGREFWIGNHRLLEEKCPRIDETIKKHIDDLQSEGYSVVIIGNNSHVCGLLGISDSLRPHAREVVSQLKQLGINRVIILTGDNEGTARWVAREVGADEYRAQLLPQEKVAIVESLVASHKVVAMVGDGINDAPAMAVANVGIAMGAAASDTAIETADIALMSDDLMRLPWLIRHSRRTRRVVFQNIVFALGTKGVFMLLTVLGMASLWLAIVADMGASLLVIANGLRLLRSK